MSSLSTRGAGLSHAPRDVDSWILTKQCSGEFLANPNPSKPSSPSPRIHPPSRSQDMTTRGNWDANEVRGDIIVHRYSQDTRPGPGAYNVDRPWTSRSDSRGTVMSPSPRKTGMSIQARQAVQSPDPGAYYSATEAAWNSLTWNRNAKFASHTPRPLTRSMTTSDLQRGDIHLHDVSSAQTPGPGAYYQGVKELACMQRWKSASSLQSPDTSAALSPRRASPDRSTICDVSRRRGYMQATVSSKSKKKDAGLAGPPRATSSTFSQRRTSSGSPRRSYSNSFNHFNDSPDVRMEATTFVSIVTANDLHPRQNANAVSVAL